MSGSVPSRSWELSDGVVTIRPPRISESEALIAGRDGESDRWFGVSDKPPSPTACVVVNGVVVGWVDYDTEQEWLQPREVNVGYNIFEAHRRRGYATRAVRLLLRHLAESSDARHAYLAIDAENAGSLGVARALGAAEADRYQNEKGRLQLRFLIRVATLAPEERSAAHRYLRGVPPVVHLSLPVRDLAECREFYEEVLQCPIGRVRDTWLDVWFFGLQLTLQEHPEQVLPAGEQGVRHFGAVLDRAEFEQILERLSAHNVAWLGEDGSDGKTAVKVADPSGNVVEFKYYEDPTAYRRGLSGSEHE